MSGREFRVHYSLSLSPRCGQTEWTAMTARAQDVTCQRCLDLLDGSYQIGNRRADVKPCGTGAAYRRHYRRGERIDETCRQWKSRENADRAARTRKRKGLAA